MKEGKIVKSRMRDTIGRESFVATLEKYQGKEFTTTLQANTE